MKQLTLNGKTLGVVYLPEYAIDPWVLERYNPPFQLGFYDPRKTFGEEENMWSGSIEIPPGQWSILGRLNDITEEQAAGLAEAYEYPMTSDIMGYENYLDRGFSYCETATESLQSFFRSRGITGNPLIILNEKV